jgi:hypothetical protein
VNKRVRRFFKRKKELGKGRSSEERRQNEEDRSAFKIIPTCFSDTA